MCIEKMIGRLGGVSGVGFRVRDGIQLLLSIELCCSSGLSLADSGRDVKFGVLFVEIELLTRCRTNRCRALNRLVRITLRVVVFSRR
jgi:hypothetical protein